MFTWQTALLLCVASALADEQPYIGVRTFRKELNDPVTLSVYNDMIDEHTRLSYVKSARDAVADGSLLVYNVVIETYIDGVTFRKSCWTNITSGDKENVRLITLDSDRSVLMWTEMDILLKVYVVNIRTCQWQNVTQLTVDLPRTRSFDRNVFVVPYGKVFDLMFSNLNTCKKRLCRVSYDFEGKLIGNFSELRDDTYDPSLSKPGSSEHFPHFAPVSRGSASKGYFMFVEEADVLKLKTLDSNGEVSNTKNAHLVPRLPQDGRPFVTSNSHETFGYCWILTANRTVQCRQYDSALNVKSNLTWTIGHYATQAAMYNLAPGAGFLLLTKDSNYGSHYLTKVEVDGKHSDPVEFKGLCSPVVLYEKTRSEFYCVYGLCWDRSSGNVTVDVRCVPKRYFAMH